MTNRAIALCSVSLVSGVGYAQYATDYDDLESSPAGTVLTGQDGYYLPKAPSTNIDFRVYTYEENTLGVPVNPCGGRNFVAAVGPSGFAHGRAQRDVSWEFPGRATVSYDVLVGYRGPGGAVNHIGSFTMQPYPGSAQAFTLMRWSEPIPSVPTTWNPEFWYYSANNAAFNTVIPDPGFQNLDADVWYRWELDVNFRTNRIRQLRLTNLETGVLSVYDPSGWFLEGGSNGGLPRPTSFRLFAGSAFDGNMVAFDNLSIDSEPPPPPCTACQPCDANCDGAVDAFDVEPFIELLVGGSTPCAPCSGDVNGDGTIDAFDIEPFIACLVP